MIKIVQVDAGIVQDVLQRIQVVPTILYSAAVLLYTREEVEESVRRRWTLSILYNINNNSRIIRIRFVNKNKWRYPLRILFFLQN